MYQCHVIHHALVQQSQVVFISSRRDKFPASVSVLPPITYPLPLFPTQTDILCGFLIVIVSLYSIVF